MGIDPIWFEGECLFACLSSFGQSALFLGGSFAIGWACVAAWLGNRPEAAPLLPGTVGRLLHAASLGFLWSLVMMSVELALS